MFNSFVDSFGSWCIIHYINNVYLSNFLFSGFNVSVTNDLLCDILLSLIPLRSDYLSSRGCYFQASKSTLLKWKFHIIKDLQCLIYSVNLSLEVSRRQSHTSKIVSNNYLKEILVAICTISNIKWAVMSASINSQTEKLRKCPLCYMDLMYQVSTFYSKNSLSNQKKCIFDF